MDETTKSILRSLPSVEELVSHAVAAGLLHRYARTQVVEAVRATVEATRRKIIEGAALGDETRAIGAVGTGDAGAVAAAAATVATDQAPTGGATGRAATPAAPTAETLLVEAAVLLASWAEPGLRPVLNLTGVVIHTNLGRSALAERAIERVTGVARGYSNLEYVLDTGVRGTREVHVEALLSRLTGAEAAFAVNNNAGAVLLLLMALASGREVLVSRGQLVEIGGSFRLPDIIRAGGVRLVEVGTTNRTRIDDYESAVTSDTALLLRVHTSNYRIMGFTEEVELADLVDLGNRRGLTVADDLGSGALSDDQALKGEPTVAASLRTGADVVCFSGDKLLGGPQAGILVGRAAVIDRLRKHPVARALRLDKMTLAALEATLELYQDLDGARRDIPTLRYLRRDPAETAALANALQAAIERRCGDGFILEVEESSARAGGGSMPLVELPSHAVRIRFPAPPVTGGAPGGTASPAGAAGGPGGSPAGEGGVQRPGVPTVAALDAELRRAAVPVVARVSQDSVNLDVITLEERDLEMVAESIAWAIGRLVEGTAPSEAPSR